jgi:hypothetical protein
LEVLIKYLQRGKEISLAMYIVKKERKMRIEINKRRKSRRARVFIYS